MVISKSLTVKSWAVHLTQIGRITLAPQSAKFSLRNLNVFRHSHEVFLLGSFPCTMSDFDLVHQRIGHAGKGCGQSYIHHKLLNQ